MIIMITKDNVAIHEQIKDDILYKINTNHYPMGSRLPSERDLAELYSVSRVTIRQSISTLVSTGILYKIPGSGTFVESVKVEQQMNKWSGVVDELRKQNYQVTVKLLESIYMTYTPSEEKLWQKLNQNPSQRVYKIKRLISANDKPLLIDFNYLPEQIGAKYELFDLSKDVVYKGLETLGYTIDHAEQFIVAKSATPSRAKLLQIPTGSAMLDVERTVFSKNKEILLFTRALFAGDKYAYKMDLCLD